MMLRSILFFLFSLTFIFQGCNTLYNTNTVDLEIAVPAKIKLPDSTKKIAVKYNNCNVNYNSNSAKFNVGNNVFIDPTNLDSLSSTVYYRVFMDSINHFQFFDSVIELPPNDYTNVKLVDSFTVLNHADADSVLVSKEDSIKPNFYLLGNLINRHPSGLTKWKKTKIINPEYGLYSKMEIEQIANETDAELLFSLDYYSTTDAISFVEPDRGIEYVLTDALWNIYDLKEKKLKYFEFKTDTIHWGLEAVNIKNAVKQLPPRKDAVLNAADIAATKFAEYLSPHWMKVERLYYQSGHVDLKKTNQLIESNKWIEAAKIWKQNTTNPNKRIAAKSMYNMALVCELEGQYDAAIDWLVKSYYVFEKRNLVHAYNCTNYIQILSQRKLDVRKIKAQVY